jgi:hypothetical protein
VYQLSLGGSLQTFSTTPFWKLSSLSISILWLSAFEPLTQVKVKGRVTIALLSGERRTGAPGRASAGAATDPVHPSMGCHPVEGAWRPQLQDSAETHPAWGRTVPSQESIGCQVTPAPTSPLHPSTSCHEAGDWTVSIQPSVVVHPANAWRVPVQASISSHPACARAVHVHVSTACHPAGGERMLVQESAVSHPAMVPTVPIQPSTVVHETVV